MKKYISLMLVLMLCIGMVGMTGCKNEPASSDKSSGETSSGAASDTASGETNQDGGDSEDITSSTITGDESKGIVVTPGETGAKGADLVEDVEYQLQAPGSGEDILVVETNQGTIKVRLFENEAEAAVTAIRQNVEDGIYDGMEFDTVIKGRYLQMDVLPEKYPVELDYVKNHLYHYHGAVSLAGDGIVTSTTRMLFVLSTDVNDEVDKQILETNDFGYNENAIKKYEADGGIPMFDGHQTVFGQVFEGHERP
ncbi:MAG TPA: hypothetical protein DEQ02_09755 [Ruminococcaceae bacterium]|nr:hypothetical protein [Oscillospiraceae bacterium]